MTEKEIRTRVENTLDLCLCDIYNELDIKSGDIDPMIHMAYNESVTDIVKIFQKLIEFNS